MPAVVLVTARRVREPALEALVDLDDEVRLADARVHAVLVRVFAGQAAVADYGCAVMDWMQARRRARARLRDRAGAPLDEALEDTFPASDPVPGAAALTPAVSFAGSARGA